MALRKNRAGQGEQSIDQFRRPEHRNDLQRSVANSRASHTAQSSSEPVGKHGAHSATTTTTTAERVKQTNAAASVAAAQRNRKRKRRNRVLAAVLSVLLLGILGGVGYGIWYMNDLDSAMALDEEEALALSDSLVAAADSEPYYMLLLGSDAREGDTISRTDAIILARIDAQNKQVTLVSIPRDTQVTFRGSKIKINAAYYYGGAAGTVDCVSDFAGVKISHFALIHFDQMREAINILGGVYLNIEEDFTAWNGDTFEKGRHLYKGGHALSYARERKSFARGDFDRTSHQREVIEAMVDRIKEKDPTELPGIIRALANCITTDYKTMDLVALANAFIRDDDGDGKNDEITFYSAMSPSTTGTEDGTSWTFVVESEWEDLMKRVDAGEDPNGTSKKKSSSDSETESASDASSDE